MEVKCHYRNDPERSLKDPLPEPGGRKFIFRVYSGHINQPVALTAGWFSPPFPKYVWRKYVSLPICLFFAWRYPFTSRGGYAGLKLYGVDSPAYKLWMNPDDVYEGSNALHLSIRPFADLTK